MKHPKITKFIRADQYFMKDILPLVTNSFHSHAHYILTCIPQYKLAQHQEVANWIYSNGPSTHTREYVDNRGFVECKGGDHYCIKHVVVGISLSQLSYKEVAKLAKENTHHICTIPSGRDGLLPTKNPFLFTMPESEWLYFIPNKWLA